MDRTDVTICLFLMMNSRAPYHELASKLGLSINAVHKRIGVLTNSGIIRAFTAHQSLVSLGAVTVWTYGRSEAARPGEVHLNLKTDDRTYWVANSGGGYVYVGGYLKSLSELDEYVAFVKKTAGLTDPTVGIMPMTTNRFPNERLRPLDLQILGALSKDSRKPVSEVAMEVNASAKTVHRRLEWMVEKGLVDFSIDWYPDASNDIVSLCHVEIKGADRQKAVEILRQKFSRNILVEVLFSNFPNLIVLFLWTNSMKQMEDLRENIEEMDLAKSAMLNVLQIGYLFDTWRDKLPPSDRKRLAATSR
jgi:DNA-binding Lrp family transcriptional regulator